MKPNNNLATLWWMVFLSLALGVFISYFFVFVNALFISEIGTSQLPLAYIFSGLGGTIITWLFNSSEKKIGFAKSATIFCLFFALVMFVLWYFYVNGIGVYYLIFFAYAWFWVSINFTSLVFWKLPSNIFDLSENKKYNGVISSGEVISAIVAYLSVPALLSLESFSRDKLLLISFFGILSFSFISFILGSKIKPQAKNKPDEKQIYKRASPSVIYKEKYFQLIFLSVFLGVIIQLLIDFSLMEVSAHQMSDAEELAKFFAFLFGGMRLLELILKSFLSKFLLKEYGVFISLSTLIFALAFIVVVGLSSLFIGYTGLILIVAALSKLFERSLYRSIYAPTINVLYQAYPITKRALTQNYADGFGKTVGQLVAAVLIFSIAKISGFESKVFMLLLSILLILVLWQIVSKKLIFHYKIELSNILHSLQDYHIPEKRKGLGPSQGSSSNDKSEENHVDILLQKQKMSLPQLQVVIEDLLKIEDRIKIASSKKDHELVDTKKSDIDTRALLQSLIETVEQYPKNDLLRLDSEVQSMVTNKETGSPLLILISILIQVQLLKITPNFNFFNFHKKLLAKDFLLSALIQNMALEKYTELKEQDYFFLLEERVMKYTYLQACIEDLSGNSPFLQKLLISESNTTKNDLLIVLSFRYDQKSLNRIARLLSQEDKSQKLIALELLELQLKEQEKKWVLPIFRDEKPEYILRKLESEFPQALIGAEKRLLSILANNEVEIPSIIKGQALMELLKKYPTNNYGSFTHSFLTSPKLFLKKVSASLNGHQNSLPDADKHFYLTYLGIAMDDFLEADSGSCIHHFFWGCDTSVAKTNKSYMLIHSLYSDLYGKVFPLENV